MAVFEVGDIVQLKSGGPKMTVVGITRVKMPGDPAVDNTYVRCSWFRDKKLEEQVFDPQALNKARESEAQDKREP